MLSDIISICRKRRIYLLITYAPEFKRELQMKCSNAGIIFEKISEMAIESGVLFIRNDKLDICNNYRLFANYGHVNKTGARLYSMILASQLKDAFARSIRIH